MMQWHGDDPDYAMVEKPWRTPANTPSLRRSRPGVPVEPPSFVVDAPPLANTLYEENGEFVVEGVVPASLGNSSLQACAARRCCSFMPDQHSASMPTAGSAFKCCHTSSFVAVRESSDIKLGGHVLRMLHQHGRAGHWLEQFVFQTNLVRWAILEYWALSAFWHVVGLCRRAWPRALLGVSRQQKKCLPRVAWHPHRDMLATLSDTGVVAVHSIGDGFAESTTHYLHRDFQGMVPLSLSWQPNSISGSLAIGFSSAIQVWQRSHNEGWWCAWSLQGNPFACQELAWSPDGRYLATAGAHGIVRVWLHSCLPCDQTLSSCVTLHRWHSGPVADIQWCPDGAILAVVYKTRGHFLRLWDTSTWRVLKHVNLGGVLQQSLSMAWCNNDTLIGNAGEYLFELSGIGIGGGGWASGFEPSSCLLPVPRVMAPDGAGRGASRRSVLQVAVCPRTRQRVALIVENCPQILVFERLCAEGWERQELVLRGLIGAALGATEPGVADAASGAAELARPCALAFAGRMLRRPRVGDTLYEGSMLAVYWDFGGGTAPEVRTYPMHYVPYGLMHNDASVAFD
mmetsp:Transcript_22380/g.43600  ORF Transcript_22380/g.43600 Transcript_22380/m.43600 type:complete len:569 (-) Transcript_22380:3-1709(-)